jgi:hypothetical protein
VGLGVATGPVGNVIGNVIGKVIGKRSWQEELPKSVFWEKRSLGKIFGFKSFPKKFLKYTERLVARIFLKSVFLGKDELAKRHFWEEEFAKRSFWEEELAKRSFCQKESPNESCQKESPNESCQTGENWTHNRCVLIVLRN